MRSCIQAVGRLLLCLLPIAASAQDSEPAQGSRRLLHDIGYRVEASATCSDGDFAPFWLTANRHGLSSVENNSTYLRTGICRSADADSMRHWRIGYGADIAVAANHTSSFIIQQLYTDIQYNFLEASIGAKQRPMEMKNNRLSSGAQTLGINARPIPQVRISVPQYTPVPYTRDRIQVKGHMAYGRMTDDSWQHSFTQCQSLYADDVLYHSKAGYLRIGAPQVVRSGSSSATTAQEGTRRGAFSVEMGIEMATQFGGTTHVRGLDGQMHTDKNASDLQAFWNAFVPGGGENFEYEQFEYVNKAGNHLGSWLIRLNYERPSWTASLYLDHFFEDQSSMFMLDYDGYGTGSQWNTRQSNRYLLYDFKDALIGAELQFPKSRWVSNIVVEYIHTTYQSGPIYHDHNIGLSDHVGGNDDYYNHYIYPGWQHWGQVIGNPLYRSPIYNSNDGTLRVRNNRFTAWHAGISGHPAPTLTYRIMATRQRGLGTYTKPFYAPCMQTSLMAEAHYLGLPFSGKHSSNPFFQGWDFGIAVGYDHGKIIGNNIGLQVIVAKQGFLK